MVVSGGGEDLVFVSGNGGVVGDEFGYDFVGGFNIKGEWVDIYEDNVFGIFFVRKNISLDGGIESDSFIGVDVFGCFFVIEEFFNKRLDFGDMGRIIDKDDIVDFGFFDVGVFENLFNRF